MFLKPENNIHKCFCKSGGCSWLWPGLFPGAVRSSSSPGCAGQSSAFPPRCLETLVRNKFQIKKNLKNPPNKQEDSETCPTSREQHHVRKPREVCEPSLAPAGRSHPIPANLHRTWERCWPRGLAICWDHELSRRILSPVSPPRI